MSVRTAYARGASFERDVRDYLELAHYLVTRSPASKSAYDLCALAPLERGGGSALIQCKTGGALPPDDWNELYALALAYGAVPLCARRRKIGPKRKVGIELLRLAALKKPDHAGPNPWLPWEP